MILRSSQLLCFFSPEKTSRDNPQVWDYDDRSKKPMELPPARRIQTPTAKGGCQSRGDFSSKEVDWMDQGLVIQWCFFVPNININIMGIFRK